MPQKLTLKGQIEHYRNECARLYEAKEMDNQLILELTNYVNELKLENKTLMKLITMLNKPEEIETTMIEGTLSERAKKARAEYNRERQRKYMSEWRKKNPEKEKAIKNRFYERLADRMEQEANIQ